MAVFACESCRAVVSFGASECRECGLPYRYVEGKAVADGDEEEETEPARAPEPFRLPAEREAEPAGYAPSNALAAAVVVALAAAVSATVLPVLAGLLFRLTPPFVGGFIASPDEIGVVLVVFGAGVMATFLVAAVLFLFWIHDASRSARSLTTGLAYTPRAAVVWWFVPLASIIVPYRVMAELWKVSHAAKGEDWKQTDTSALMPCWWTLWLGIFVMERMITVGVHDEPSAWVLLVAVVVFVGAAVLASWIVMSIHRGLSRKARAVESL